MQHSSSPHRLSGLRLRRDRGASLPGQRHARRPARRRRLSGPIEVVAAAPGAAARARSCRDLLRRLRTALGKERCGVTLLLATDRRMRDLNRRHRGKDITTDVLSFPSGGPLEPGVDHLGEIAVSLGQAGRQARRARWPLGCELALLLTHGFLHLLGYDHETDDGTMRRLEARLLDRVARVRLERRSLPWGDAPAPVTRTRRGPRSRRKDD